MTDLYTTEDKTMPIAVYVLYLVGIPTCGLTSLVGMIIAYAQQATASAVMRTHYTFQIRTFWLGLAWMVAAGLLFAVGLPLSFILIGIPMLLLAKLMWAVGIVWFIVRCALGLMHLGRGEAYPRPYAVLA